MENWPVCRKEWVRRREVTPPRLSAVFGQVVKVMPRETDRYGRTVADVILVDGRILNHQLVRAGLTGQRCPGEPAPRPGEWEAGHACKSLPKLSVRSGRP